MKSKLPLPLLIIPLLATGCTLGENVIVSKDSSHFLMSYINFHHEEINSMDLIKNDELYVSFANEKGNIDIKIGVSNQPYIYGGTGQVSGDFTVIIDSDGTYLLTVAGHNATGSIIFTKNPNERAV